MSEATSQLAVALRDAIALGPGERLYGVVDAAQDADFALDAQRRFGLPMRMLFQGEAAQYMGEVAPYLVPIPLDSEYLEAWADRWGKNVGILLTTSAAPDKVLRHLRDVFVVKDEEGQEYFFRFYDPRALRVYLPTCTPQEGLEFFGPVRSFLCEAEGPGAILQFTSGREDVHQEAIALPSVSPSCRG